VKVKGPAGRAARVTQRGHLLILLMVGLTVMLIMLTVAAQSWTFQMRREMEKELIFRGEQYINGLLAFRKANGNAFPVGDLKVLAQKNMSGVRFMRKLYKNPMDPNGTWQYLYLHPGGTGFINPCAVGGGIGFNDPRNSQMAGQVPVGGFGLPMGGGGIPMGGSGGKCLGCSLPGDTRTIGTRSNGDSDDEDGNVPAGSSLSAMDPKTFKQTGVQKMNLPIVGVVNCQMIESIATYKGQSYLSNWAFTPLAQGEFGGNAQPGGLGTVAPIATGVGLGGSQAYQRGQRQPGNQPGVFSKENPWSRDGKYRPQPPPDDQDNSDITGGDPNRSTGDPNRRQQDPNQPARNPNDPNGRPQDPNQTVHDPNNPSDVEPGDEEDDSEDSSDEDPNAPGGRIAP
jgi:type II secretory pathway pseudopilin PulG